MPPPEGPSRDYIVRALVRRQEPQRPAGSDAPENRQKAVGREGAARMAGNRWQAKCEKSQMSADRISRGRIWVQVVLMAALKALPKFAVLVFGV